MVIGSFMHGQLRFLDFVLLIVLIGVGMFYREIHDAWVGRRMAKAQRKSAQRAAKWLDQDRDYER